MAAVGQLQSLASRLSDGSNRPVAALRIISNKETFAHARTIMHMRTDKSEGLLMNQSVIENIHALLLSIIRTGASV